MCVCLFTLYQADERAGANREQSELNPPSIIYPGVLTTLPLQAGLLHTLPQPMCTAMEAVLS
jgi:hypothetical protein